MFPNPSDVPEELVLHTMAAGCKMMRTCDTCKARKVRCSGISELFTNQNLAAVRKLMARQDIQALQIV